MSKIFIYSLLALMAVSNKVYALHETFHIMGPVQITDYTGIQLVDASSSSIELHMNGILPDSFEYGGQYSSWYLTDAHLDLTPIFLFTPSNIYDQSDFLTWNIFSEEWYGQDSISLNVTDPMLDFTSYLLTIYSWELFPGGYTDESEPYHDGGYIPSSYSLTMSNDTASITVSTIPLPPTIYLFLSSIGLVFIKKRITVLGSRTR